VDRPGRTSWTNLVLAIVGLILARTSKRRRAPAGRLALFAFNAFWIAGYLIYAGDVRTGRQGHPGEGLSPCPGGRSPWSIGVALYALTMDIDRRLDAAVAPTLH
jgi:hypothetical protein